MQQVDRRVHLFRGARPVRTWSKHQKTVPQWTLCGINRERHAEDPAPATDRAEEVTCPHCLDLMRP